MDSTRCTERLVVADERRPAIATRVPLPAPLPGAEHDVVRPVTRRVPARARVVSIEDARAERARCVLERFQRRVDVERA